MTWNNPHPTSKPQQRKPPSSSRQEPPWRNSTGPPPTPTDCKRNFLDSTWAQMTDTIVCALGMFLCVHLLPQLLFRIWVITNGKYHHETYLATHTHITHLLLLQRFSSGGNSEVEDQTPRKVNNCEDEHQNATGNSPNAPQRWWRDNPAPTLSQPPNRMSLTKTNTRASL